jgi:protein phosphatase
MATTIVSLHLDADRATIGHVGDSRLYRLAPNGQLFRETADHSMVEEEVRAGRMTPEQAANHPSKNVISRALGAEESVEVDLKTIEVEEGTCFLLCSDGITRHITDPELRELLSTSRPPDEVCQEMKRRCYERGAEDNLTAVIVQVGVPKFDADDDGDRTVATARIQPLAPTAPLSASAVSSPPPPITPASRVAFPGPNAPVAAEANMTSRTQVAPPKRRRGGFGFLIFLLIIAVGAGAFYGGMKYPVIRSWIAPPKPTPTVTPSPDRSSDLEQKRAAVDANPQKWISDHLPISPEDHDSPEFMYLYGRALMLTGDQAGALRFFDLALTNVRQESKGKLPLDAELRLASASAALKLREKSPDQRSQEALMAEQRAMHTLDELLNLKTEGGK